MIGKVKKWLGIEGVKLEIRVPDGQKLTDQAIVGKLIFQSLQEQTVTGYKIVLIEKYSRGRGDEQLIDEYELGKLEIKDTFTVVPGEEVVRSFNLDFSVLKSDVDQWGDRNILNKGISNVAKWMRKASSSYRVEAEARVEGVALNPYDKKKIELK